MLATECRCHVLGRCDRPQWHSEIFARGLAMLSLGADSIEYRTHVQDAVERNARRDVECLARGLAHTEVA